MKIHTLIIMLGLSASAIAGDILTDLQGKWKVDAVATKATPEVKQMLEGAGPMGAQILKAMTSSNYDFAKDKVTIKTDAGGEPMEMAKSFKVVENTEKVLVFTGEGDPGNTYVYRQGKGFIIRDAPTGEEPKNVPPLVLMR
jgi:hypothetical protein